MPGPRYGVRALKTSVSCLLFFSLLIVISLSWLLREEPNGPSGQDSVQADSSRQESAPKPVEQSKQLSRQKRSTEPRRSVPSHKEHKGARPRACPNCGSTTWTELRPKDLYGWITIRCECVSCAHKWTYRDWSNTGTSTTYDPQTGSWDE